MKPYHTNEISRRKPVLTEGESAGKEVSPVLDLVGEYDIRLMDVTGVVRRRIGVAYQVCGEGKGGIGDFFGYARLWVLLQQVRVEVALMQVFRCCRVQ